MKNVGFTVTPRIGATGHKGTIKRAQMQEKS